MSNIQVLLLFVVVALLLFVLSDVVNNSGSLVVLSLMTVAGISVVLLALANVSLLVIVDMLLSEFESFLALIYSVVALVSIFGGKVVALIAVDVLIFVGDVEAIKTCFNDQFLME